MKKRELTKSDLRTIEELRYVLQHAPVRGRYSYFRKGTIFMVRVSAKNLRLALEDKAGAR